jgi:hypothetical protein
LRNLMTRALPGLVVALLVLLSPLSAMACEKCFKFFDDESCKDVGLGESGFEKCEVPAEASCCCKMSGNACTGTSSGGSGGTGGTGGGGSNVCQTNGFCPAQCFSCSGGGGRPAV